MKKLSLFVVLLCFTSMASAQTPKLGYVNSVKLLRDAPQAIVAGDRLLKKFEPKQKAFTKKRTVLTEDSNSFKKESPSMPESERKEKLLELRKRLAGLKQEQDNLNREIAEERSKEMREVQKLLRKTIQEYGKKKKFTIIFFEGVAYADDSIDVTDDIITILKAK